MKKAKKLVIILIVIVAIVAGLWIGGKKLTEYAENQKEEKEVTVESLSKMEYGDTYVYSDEDVQDFIKKATALMEHDIKTFGVQYGENRIIKLQQQASNDFELKLVEDGVISEEILRQDRERTKLNMNYSAPDLSDSNYVVYYSSCSSADVFNKDLSLKDPYVFYGYTSVDNPSLEVMKSASNFKKYFDYFVATLKIIDEDFKDSSAQQFVEQLIDFDEAFIKNTGNPDKRIGAAYALYHQWLNEEKENSTNPLQRLLKVEVLEDIDEILPFLRQTKVIEQHFPDYDPLPSKYNYWEVDESEYFTVYWPSSISKIDDLTYVVNIETEKPVDRYGATIIAQYIQCRFEKNLSTQYNEDGYFKVIVKIGDTIYHDMMHGVVSADVVGGSSIHDGKYAISGFTTASAIGEWQAWTPSKEVRPWVSDYFELAAKAYENDSYFSIFETIEQIAEKYNADYLDVENVIMSCYWTFNGYDYQLGAGKYNS